MSGVANVGQSTDLPMSTPQTTPAGGQARRPAAAEAAEPEARPLLPPPPAPAAAAAAMRAPAGRPVARRTARGPQPSVAPAPRRQSPPLTAGSAADTATRAPAAFRESTLLCAATFLRPLVRVGESEEEGDEELSLDPTYAALEGVVAVSALLGNGVVLVAFARERRLRRRTNYYIASLAVADLLVGLLGL
ncbi:atherin-like [Schistocerca americana]|uniref:atherin-like n=1 Tax=Schistocerca americana TaxID=7009 RepID=UPI001F5005F0|nr:atherin-like [Schistocerca americana]